MSILIEKVDTLLEKLEDVKNNWGSKYSIAQLVSETELLFYFYDNNYPILLDIKAIKEKHVSSNYLDFKTIVASDLIFYLNTFKEYLQMKEEGVFNTKIKPESNLSLNSESDLEKATS